MQNERIHVSTYAPSAFGGHARYCSELLTALAELDDPAIDPLEVSLVTSANLDPAYRDVPYPIEDVLPPIVPRPEFKTPVQWAAARVAHYVKRERVFLQWLRSNDACDAVHFQEYTPWLAPRDFKAIRNMNKRLFYTVHNVQPHMYPPGVPQRLYDSWNRAAWRQCDALFVHSEGLKDELSVFLEGDHPLIVVVPHGVWSTRGTDKLAMPPIQPGKRLLFFGQLRRIKGLNVLLEAMTQLPPDYTLTIAGSPETPAYKDEVRELVSHLPSKQIRLVDRFVDDAEIPEFFSEADLVVLPYTSFKAQSGVLHDAIAYGRPVVASDVGALGESVRRWKTGTVVPANDTSALARAIRTTLEAETYAAAMEASYAIRGELSWSQAARITAETYRARFDHG